MGLVTLIPNPDKPELNIDPPKAGNCSNRAAAQGLEGSEVQWFKADGGFSVPRRRFASDGIFDRCQVSAGFLKSESSTVSDGSLRVRSVCQKKRRD
jgi:hypothetical protein